jgi:hypothetical protein
MGALFSRKVAEGLAEEKSEAEEERLEKRWICLDYRKNENQLGRLNITNDHSMSQSLLTSSPTAMLIPAEPSTSATLRTFSPWNEREPTFLPLMDEMTSIVSPAATATRPDLAEDASEVG